MITAISTFRLPRRLTVDEARAPYRRRLRRRSTQPDVSPAS
jgi:hypothetical protein